MATRTNMSSIVCDNCQKSQDKMKRCTRCRIVYYCSQECQIKDWSQHKENCQSSKNFEDTETIYKIPSPIKSCESDNGGFKNSRINFEKAASDLKSNSKVEPSPGERKAPINESHKFYYLNNQSLYDVPIFKSDLPYTKITVKREKAKKKFDINMNWTGKEIYKFLSSELEIPYEKLKIINKGKVVREDTICDCMAAPKPVFQILGEKCENEEGLDKNDIDVMMKQLGIEEIVQ